MTRTIFTALAVLMLTVQASHAADATQGETKYKTLCGTCHAVDPSQKRMAAHLKGIVGRKAASVEGVSYSPAMKASNWVWDKAKLDAYLADPRKALPGTSMMIGVANATDRANIIAYLETLK